MAAYEYLSKKYDLFMRDTPYDDWAAYAEKAFKKYMHNKPELVLDLACGTGNITKLLSGNGHDVIGVDISEEMLILAKEKLPEALFLNQDMTELELYGTVDAAVCFCDGINYLISKDDVLKTLSNVNNYLNQGGLFIFDINTEYKFKSLLADNIFAEAFDDAAYIWENNYDEEEKINEYMTNIFIKDGEKYARYEECHYERAYTLSEMESFIERTGFNLLETRDGDTFGDIRPDSERIIFVIQRK